MSIPSSVPSTPRTFPVVATESGALAPNPSTVVEEIVQNNHNSLLQGPAVVADATIPSDGQKIPKRSGHFSFNDYDLEERKSKIHEHDSPKVIETKKPIKPPMRRGVVGGSGPILPHTKLTADQIKNRGKAPEIHSSAAVLKDLEEGEQDLVDFKKKFKLKVDISDPILGSSSYDKKVSGKNYINKGDKWKEANKKPCFKYINLGICEAGDNCRFSHEVKNKDTKCRNFEEGKCKFGSSCKFSHETSNNSNKSSKTNKIKSIEPEPIKSDKSADESPVIVPSIVVGDSDEEEDYDPEKEETQRLVWKMERDNMKGFVHGFTENKIKRKVMLKHPQRRFLKLGKDQSYTFKYLSDLVASQFDINHPGPDIPPNPPPIDEPPDINSRMERRELVVVMEKHNFPDLDFIGDWNNSNFSYLDKCYVNHSGAHVHFVDKEIELPSGLISELGTFWAYKKHDLLHAEFLTSVVKCKKWTELALITYEQERIANIYAPAIAYRKFWMEQQNASRVVDQSYWNWKEKWINIIKNYRFWKNSPTSMKIGASFSFSLGAILFLYKLYTYYKKFLKVKDFLISLTQKYKKGYLVGSLGHASLIKDLLDCTKRKVERQVELQGSTVLLFSCFGAPIWEEYVKRKLQNYWYLDGSLQWYEFFQYFFSLVASGFDPDRVAIVRSVPLIMHYLVLKAPTYLQSVFWHSLYNIIALIFFNEQVGEYLMQSEHCQKLIAKEKDALFRDEMAALVYPNLTEEQGSATANLLPKLFNQIIKLTTPIVSTFYNLFTTKIITASFRSLSNVTCPPPDAVKPKSKVVFTGTPNYLRYKIEEENKGKQYCLAFNTLDYSPLAYASNLNNEKESAAARVVAETIIPTPGAIEECVDWCKLNHKELFPRINKIKSLTMDQYLKGSNASPSVKRILRETYEKMKKEGYDENSVLTKEEKYKWTTRSSFVKVENNLYQSPAGVTIKAPRMIQGAQPEYICIVGPWIAALQIVLKRRWGKKNFLCFTSGLNSKELAGSIDKDGWKKIEDDLGKFDTSIRRPWCEYELFLCEKFGAPKAVLDLMEANIKTHGFTHHGLSYRVDGTRKSGDPFTSLFNSIINGLSHLFLYCVKFHPIPLPVSTAKQKIVMILQGDDNVLAHKDDKIFPWQAGMATLGFDSKAMYRTNVDLEFCSNRLYDTSSGLVFGPKPGKVLAKLGYIINPPMGVSRESLMRGVALGLEQQCSFIPPIKVVIDRILFLTKDFSPHYIKQYEEHKMLPPPNTICTPATMFHLHEQYGWTNEMQSDFEDYVNKMNFGDDFDHPYAKLLFDRDTSGPKIIFQ